MRFEIRSVDRVRYTLYYALNFFELQVTRSPRESHLLMVDKYNRTHGAIERKKSRPSLPLRPHCCAHVDNYRLTHYEQTYLPTLEAYFMGQAATYKRDMTGHFHPLWGLKGRKILVVPSQPNSSLLVAHPGAIPISRLCRPKGEHCSQKLANHRTITLVTTT